jgi:two-component system, NtrC family, response regulator HydG
VLFFDSLGSAMPALSAETHALLDCLDDPAIIVSAEYQIVAANRAYQRIYHDHKEIIGRHCYTVSHRYSLPCDQSGETCPLRESQASGKARRSLHLHYTPHGREHVDVEIMPLPGAKGRSQYFIEIMRHSRIASTRPGAAELVGISPAFMRMLELLQRVAHTEATVLLLGESGTGKELAARALHESSRRAGAALVPVDCSGLTETLFESELFGYEKGAFTGANTRKRGLVESAAGGTLFLDELGDIPLTMQVKLLRLIESGTYRRVGGIEPLQANFRLVCATHRNLEAMVAAGTFRQDLYYRISVFPIRLPPLRERCEDLPLLAETLLQRIFPDKPPQLSADALSCLHRYDFPGNIRELRNLLERAALLSDNDHIYPHHLSDACQPRPLDNVFPYDEIIPLVEMEKHYLRWAAHHHHGDRASLAQCLGLSARTLYRRLREAGVV